MAAEKTAGKQRGKPFARGTSGNASGRPRGARNKATVAAESLFDGEAEGLARKAITLALAGDVTALRLSLERLIPPRKDRPVAFDLPPLSSSADAAKAMMAIVQAVAAGEITPSEAFEVSRIIQNFSEVLKTNELEQRIAALETKQ